MLDATPAIDHAADIPDQTTGTSCTISMLAARSHHHAKTQVKPNLKLKCRLGYYASMRMRKRGIR